MTPSVSITSSTFAAVFHRFLRQVELAEESPGPFHDFQSGLAHSMERYKEWLYFEARHRLNVEAWTKDWVGTGKILLCVIAAIEINEGKERRNNIVEWQGKRGPESKSTLKLLAARDDRRQWLKAERALWDMYADLADAEACFGRLVDLFGGHYNLISYLFFMRDWNVFMPMKSSFFPKAFELLGVPHPMVRQCHWENYAGAMARLRAVQQHLAGYNIPNGVRLVDAHTFCWMLVCLDVPPNEAVLPLRILPLNPIAGDAPVRGGGGSGTTQSELEDIQRNQKRIGGLAQSIVLAAERQRLERIGRTDLAQRGRDVSDDGSLGYDIASFTSEGRSKPIEVKAAAKRGNDLRFFLSENERVKASELPDYHLVLVLNVESKKPLMHDFTGRDLPKDALFPVQYEVRLRGTQA